MFAMTSSRLTTSKVLLVPGGRAAAEGDMAVPVRRYRLARVLPEYRPGMHKPPANRGG
jgi:hypothetical protein